MELAEVMRTTAAVRSFRDEEVDDVLVEEVLDAARFAPSGGNRQPWRVVVIRSKKTRAGIESAYKKGWREYLAFVREGLVPFSPSADGSYHGPAVDLEKARSTPAPDDFADQLATVPVMLVLFAHLPSLAVTDNGLSRQSIVGGASVYPFGHNILLAARDRGLAGVMTTVICRSEDEVRALLGAGPELAVAGLVLLGRPVHQPTRLSRRQVAEFATVDRLDGAPFGARLRQN